MAKRTLLKNSDINKINAFLELLAKERIKVSQVILYGSYAKGHANTTSDIDLAIISKQFEENTAKNMMFLRKLALKIDSRLEPVPLSPNDLEEQYSTFIDEITHYGKNFFDIAKQ